MSTSTSDFRERAGQRSTEARDYDSTPSLLRRLMNDVGTLFTQEAALLKAEMGRSIGEMKAATISLAMGGAVLFLGLIFLLLAAVYALSNVLDPWLAALIVGGVVTAGWRHHARHGTQQTTANRNRATTHGGRASEGHSNGQGSKPA